MKRRLLVLSLLGLLVLTGMGLISASGSAASAGGPRVVEIEMEARQWEFGPGIITVNEGDLVRIHLISMDVDHGFYLDGYGVKREAEAGRTTTIEFVADRPGRWMYRCSTTCGSFHPYMIGWLRVRPNWYAGAGWAVTALAGLGFTGYFVALGVRKP